MTVASGATMDGSGTVAFLAGDETIVCSGTLDVTHLTFAVTIPGGTQFVLANMEESSMVNDLLRRSPVGRWLPVWLVATGIGLHGLPVRAAEPDVAPAESSVTVALNPLGLAQEDLLLGGANRRTASLCLNVPLVRRVVLAPDDVQEATLTLVCRRSGARFDALAAGAAQNGQAVNMADQKALRRVQLKAGDELALAVWKADWHYNGGATLSGLRIVCLGPDGRRREAVLPAAFENGTARTELGAFALAGLFSRDKFPKCENRVGVQAGGKPGVYFVAGAAGGYNVSLSLGTAGLHLHTNGRANWDAGYGWAPALVFTPAADGIYAIEGTLAFCCARPEQKVAWRVGCLTRPGGPLAGTSVALHRLLHAPAGEPVAEEAYEREPLARITLKQAEGETIVVTNGIAPALRHWLDGSWPDHGLLLVADKADGAPADVLVQAAPKGSATVREYPKTFLFDHAFKPQQGVYATMKDGKLFYGDRRLRLWGMVKDGPAERIRCLGFNCLRAWFQSDFYSDESARKGEVMAYTPGDGSKLDRFDYLMADMKKHDVFVMFATMIGLGMPMKDVVQEGSWLHARHGKDPDWSVWTNAVLKADNGRCDQLSYVDDRLWTVRLKHAENVLNHVNPYTSKRYAEEEIIVLIEINNEAGHVKFWLDRGFKEWPEYFQQQLRKRWCGYARAKYGDDAKLRAAWGRLDDGESLTDGTLQLEPLATNYRNYSRTRQIDFQTFLIELIDRRNQAYIAHCRRQAPKGVGVNVVPFSCDSQYRPSMPWAYQNWRGDSGTVSMYFWQNSTMLALPPGLYVLDSHRLDGKLATIYEIGRGRPSRYRTETPYTLGVFTDWQDFDIAVWHGAWIGSQTGEELLAGSAMPPATSHFWTAVHLENDPVMSAAVALGGRLFLNGIVGTATNPAIYTIGYDGIFGLAAWNGVGGCDMSQRVFTRGARIRFEPERRETAVLVDGQPPAPLPAIEGPVQTGPYATWDWPNERLIIDAPAAKVYVGRTCDAWTFKDGIVLSGLNTPWIAFALISQDGKPLAESSAKAWVSAVYDAKDTDFDYDYQCAGGPLEQAKAVKNRGHAPILVDKVAYTVSFPRQTEMRYFAYDFALRETAARDVKGGNVLRQPPHDDWMGVVEFGARGAAAEAVVDPSPGARQAREQTGAALAIERTDPKLAGVWNPVPNLSWGDSYHRAHRVIRDGGFLQGKISAEDVSRAADKTIVLPNAVFLLDMPATLEVRFSNDSMRMVTVAFEQAPAYVDLVALLTAKLGRPAREKLVNVAFEQSEVEWIVRQPGGTLTVLATEVQGVVRVTYALQR